MVIEDIFREYQENKDKIDISISKMKADLGDLADNIVLYGAGSAGIAFLYYLRDAGIYPRFFADGNPDKWGKDCEGLEIIDYKEITKRVGSDALVIVTINTDGVKYCKSFDEALRAGGHAGVHKNLRDAGCKNVIDYTYFRRCRELFRGDRYNLPSCSDVYCMEKNKDKICEAYELMADEKSREVFEKLVRFRLLDDTIRIPTEPQDKQYFEYTFFPRRDDEVFVDCGAYNGISLRTFLNENNNRFERYYAFEPDRQNYRLLSKYIDTLPQEIKCKIEAIDRAASDTEENLKLYSLNGPGSFIADIGNQSVKGIRIDDAVEKTGASFIKMNIEGYEIRALNGAKNTIKCCKPRMAIAGYHKTNDLWEVPLLIWEIQHDTKIYLRSYMNNLSFIFYSYSL